MLKKIHRRRAANTAGPLHWSRSTASGASSSCRSSSCRATGRCCRNSPTPSFHRCRDTSYSHPPLGNLVKNADGKFAVLAVSPFFIKHAVTLQGTITGNEKDLSQPALFQIVRQHPIVSHLPGSYGLPVIIPIITTYQSQA